MTARAKTVTILFTDLVGSTELLQRAGDEQAQRIFKAHHRLLREAVEAHGGHEVKWLGDGLMVAFDSAQEAVKCAIAMQQASRRPAAGERLEIRAGLNVGEALVDESDYFGTPVVIARRLCDRAGSGQIFASEIVVRLLGGRGADISTNDLGPLELKGITNAVPAVEIVYQHDPMALLRKLPFVGRQAEYETLLKKLADAQKGHGSVVLLAGEPGIGKTRLTEEFCEHASSGAIVIRGNCYEGDIAAPFGPWTEALRSLIEQLPDDALRASLGPGAPDIAAMMAEVRRRLPDIEEAPRLDPEAERARLFESVGAFLRNATDNRPLVIFLDDLHWCDRPSLALLEFVARGSADRRIVILGAYRDVEVDRVHPLAQTLAALRRMEHHERLTIRGFTQDSVYDLLSAIEPSERAEATRRALAGVLHVEAEGNPFFIREVLNNLIETGKLVQQDGVWTGTVTSIEELGIPEGIKEVIGRRLSRLSEGCNRMLQRASAMTSGFSWDELRAICDDPEDELLDALDEALGSQLIEEREKLSFAFTHALIRATLYDELSTPRRVVLHRRVAEALEALYGANVEPHLGELAHHFYQAAPGGDVEKAMDYAKRAGDQAMTQVAWEAAAAHYERALEAMDLVASPDERVRVDILLALGRALFMAGVDPSRRRPVFQRAFQLARSAGDSERCARAALGFASAQAPGVVDADAVRLLEQALQLLGPAESALRARVLAQLGWELSFSEEHDRRERLVADALQMARRVDHPETLAYVLGIVAWLEVDAARVLSLTREQIQAASRSGDKFEIFRAHANLVRSMLALGDRAGLDQAVEEEERLGRELRIRSSTGFHRALQARMDGRFDAAERLASQAFAELQHYNPEGAAQYFGVAVTGLRIHQGRPLEMEPGIKANAERYPAIPAYRAALAWVYSGEAGRRDDARAIFDELAQGGFGRHLALVPNLPVALSFLADVCWSLADTGRAPELYDLLSPREGECVVIGIAVDSGGAVSRSLALLAATMRRWQDAERHFEDALRTNAQLGDKPWLAQTRAQYGAMLLARDAPGDRERAVTLLQEALSFAREAGMAKVAADAERLLGAAASSSPR
jgi:class 3 adenylate cyclase/tetratricopeptide (TPR) repeat protein